MPDTLAEPGFAAALSSVWPSSVTRVLEPGPAEILVGGRPTEALLAAVAPSALVIPFAGLPQSTRTLLLNHPELACFNIHHNAQAVAETALGMLLSLSRRIAAHDAALRAGDWRTRYAPDQSYTLAGRTAVIVGWGAIARRLAPALLALGMRVRAVRRRCEAVVDRDGVRLYPSTRLADAVRGASVLVVAAPATPETEAMVSDDVLALLGVDGIVINVGRASIVDEASLFERLRSDQLFGAGLDVWPDVVPASEASDVRRLPGNHAFHALPNVILSPHRSGHARSIPTERAAQLAALIDRIATGDTPTPMDVAAGY